MGLLGIPEAIRTLLREALTSDYALIVIGAVALFVIYRMMRRD